MPFPLQVFLATVFTGTVHTLKSWLIAPPFVTSNVTLPAGIWEIFDSLKESSDGFPAVTLMTVSLAARTPFL